MNKWGVRLIAVYLFAWAISDFYKLLTDNENMGDFLGLESYGTPVPIMGWIEVVIYIYAGIQLLRFKPSGRNWALFIFGLLSLFSGAFLVVMVAVWINSYFTLAEFPLTFDFPGSAWLGEIGTSIISMALLVGLILFFYFLPTYFLMRKDVKRLFDKIDTTETSAPNSEVTAS